MKASIKLANWVIQNFKGEDLTPLKLQKLCFYCYGAALANDWKVGIIRFEAWQYGPVNRTLWSRYKNFGKSAISSDLIRASCYSTEMESAFRSILSSYGKLSGRMLVQETHFEKPWLDAWERRDLFISERQLSDHFKKKFAPKNISPPKLLVDFGIISLDGIPTEGFESLEAMADNVQIY